MKPPKPPARRPRVITDLLSSRLHTLAGISAASATLRVERKFKLTLLEWRSIAMLGAFAPLALKDLAKRAALDRSYASRTVSALIARDLVASGRNDTDGRGVMLSLTDSGKALYEQVFPDAVMRNERVQARLTEDQRAQLMEILDILVLGARHEYEHERRVAAGEEEDYEAPRQASKRAAAPGDEGAPDLEEARYLVARLGRLLGKP